jgi:fermentation-respiration switch protein FrsA (DUF1100 family)
MSKIKVEFSHGYPLKTGGYVDYYNVGDWTMELVESRTLGTEIAFAREVMRTHRTWYRWLKKEQKLRKKYRTP